jgi:hypothetical protein
MPQNVSQSQLVSGIIGTVDVGSIVGRSITLQADIDRAEAKLKTIKAVMQTQFNTANSEAVSKANGDGLAIVTAAKTSLFQDINALFSEARDQAVQSAAGFGISATVLGLDAKRYSIMNHVDLETKALIDIPESIAALKVQRYYNAITAYNFASERDFFILTQRGAKPYADFVYLFQQMQALSAGDAQNVANIRNWQIGKPSLYEAWMMVQKGLKPKSFFDNIAQWGLGYNTSDSEALYQHLFYTFSPMELFRISDLTPVAPTWIASKLSALGLRPEDQTLIATMIQNRTTKDEVMQAWSILADNYSWGLQTKADLTKFLTDNNIPEAQAKAKIVVADLLLAKVTLKLLRDAEIYLYRKDVYNEDQLNTALLDLNIGTDTANAITRNEASKKGLDWELPVP